MSALTELIAATRALAGNVDVSTIRPGKKNEARWGDLKVAALAAIEAIETEHRMAGRCGCYKGHNSNFAQTEGGK